MIVVCCRCKRVRIEGEWKRPSEGTNDRMSHTYCPSCLDRARSEVLPNHHAYTPRLVRHVPVILNTGVAEG